MHRVCPKAGTTMEVAMMLGSAKGELLVEIIEQCASLQNMLVELEDDAVASEDGVSCSYICFLFNGYHGGNPFARLFELRDELYDVADTKQVLDMRKLLMRSGGKKGAMGQSGMHLRHW
ncbi:hypothetical protein AMTR_s00036p00034840 [Amborella trichopoda]|uniref:Uncharacterized protein n=1 Tax=Amborella trichopoda TaxID=13333 RepID=U5D1L3_AMBTC|nr:hypothetical protein AMTR_s00036p00034840 [Amborella trichopoda]